MQALCHEELKGRLHEFLFDPQIPKPQSPKLIHSAVTEAPQNRKLPVLIPTPRQEAQVTRQTSGARRSNLDPGKGGGGGGVSE